MWPLLVLVYAASLEENTTKRTKVERTINFFFYLMLL